MTTYEVYKKTDGDTTTTTTTLKEEHSGWCLPLIVYIVLSVLSIIFMLLNNRNQTIVNIIFSLIWIFAWGLLIWWLCKRGHTGWAWVVVFLPLIIFIILAFLAGAIVIASNR